MTEMQQALGMLGKLPTNKLISSPSGRWWFVGHVDSRLALVRKDGRPATAKDYANANSFGPGVSGMKTRTWGSEVEALEALAATS